MQVSLMEMVHRSQWHSIVILIIYAIELVSRRLMTGYLFTLCSFIVNWKATLQPTMTLSTYKAEYMVCTEAAKEGF